MALTGTSPLTSLVSPADSSGFAYSDIRSLQRIKTDEASGIRAVAQQFESLFIGMMLKSMREANAALAEGGMLSSPELSMHEEMLDQQWAIHVAESGGIGLAPIIEAQLGGEPRSRIRPADGAAIPPRGVASTVEDRGSAVPPPVVVDRQGFKRPGFPSREAFVAAVLPEVERAVGALALQPSAVLAQSALETGWGQNIIHDAEGRSSHNLFGIKAGAGWQGPRVEVKTLEVIDGRPRVETAAFRSYPGIREAVDDYVQFLESDGRYRTVLNAGSGDAFAQALQGSGYATDPAYANKIRAVIRSLRDLIGS